MEEFISLALPSSCHYTRIMNGCGLIVTGWAGTTVLATRKMAVAVLFILLLGMASGTMADAPDALQSYLDAARAEGIIDYEQSLKLQELASARGLKFTDKSALEKRMAIFRRIYNHLTLINVLYLSGATIVMGAYTIFMTIAVHRFNSATLSVIMSLHVLFFGGVGIKLWYSIHYAYVGGM